MSVYDTRRFERSETMSRFEECEMILMLPAYGFYKLANGMKVLLIQNKGNRTIITLTIRAGSMNDPYGAQGLAHLCEHALYLGSHEYPEYNHLPTYIKNHGGFHNAGTSLNFTTHYVVIHNSHLEEVLRHYVASISQPIFKKEIITSEFYAINSEFRIGTSNEFLWQDQLRRMISKSYHPYSVFTIGNMKSLLEIPIKKKINVRRRLKIFHKKFYRPNIMCLCIGTANLGYLSHLVNIYFSNIQKNKQGQIQTFNRPQDEYLRTKWYIVPLIDTRTLDIMFRLPDQSRYLKSQPVYYIMYLLKHEGQGSLLSVLKAEGWCYSVNCNNDSKIIDFPLLYITFELTEEGIEHVDDIITLLFQYIKMLKETDPEKRIYKEYNASAYYRFYHATFSYKYTLQKTLDMPYIPINDQDILSASYIFSKWLPHAIKLILRELLPENIRVHVIAKVYESIATETEKWYGTKYKKKKIPRSTIDIWEKVGLNTNFKLPSENNFIPRRYVSKFYADMDKTLRIRADISNSQVLCWSRSVNGTFAVTMRLDFFSPIVYMDAVNYACSNIFIELVYDYCLTYKDLYYAELANMSWQLNTFMYGIKLTINGYGKHQVLLLEEILDAMVNVPINPAKFEYVKEKYINELKKNIVKNVESQAVDCIEELLLNKMFTDKELLKVTHNLTLHKFMSSFMPRLFHNVHVKCYISGNIMDEGINNVVTLIKTKLLEAKPSASTLSIWERILFKTQMLPRCVLLEEGCHFLHQVENSFTNTSCVLVYYDVGPASTEKYALLQLITRIIGTPAYNKLRTQEQMGYEIHVKILEMYGTMGLIVYVVGYRYTPRYVEKRINEFLKSMTRYISNLSTEEFNKYKDNNIFLTLLGITPKETSLLFGSQREWIQMITGYICRFENQDVTLKQVEEFYKEMISKEKQRRITLHVISTKLREKWTEEMKMEQKFIDKDVQRIDNIESFKINHNQFSSSLFNLRRKYR